MFLEQANSWRVELFALSDTAELHYEGSLPGLTTRASRG